MVKKATTQKSVLKELNGQLKTLQTALVTANKLEGKDDYLQVSVKKNQARFERIKKKGVEDKAVGKFFIQIDVTSKAETIFIPTSIASGKKPTGFIYQIEGTAKGAISNASVSCRGEDVTQVTVGTLIYSKIPKGKTASFKIQVEISGNFAKTYKIIINRINYKLAVNDARYKQYLKEIASDSVTFS